MAGFETIIFDFDGTLADTREGILAVLNDTLKDNGFPQVSGEKVYPLIGLALEEIFSKLTEGASGGQVTRMAAEYRKKYALQGAVLFPGVREVLQELKAGKKTLAIASSKSGDGLNRMLENLGVRHLFDVVVTEDQVAGKKPAPDMVEKVLASTGTRKELALVVGDAVYDLRMGKAAGVKTCAALWGACDKDALVREEPDFFAEEVRQLKDFC